jgi:PKHD-type hydroxylase
MLLTIPELLNASQLEEIHRLLADAPFTDGRFSAGEDARRVKHNEEVSPGDARVAALNRLVLMPLYRHATFQAAALPRRLSGAFFARYQPGMHYGAHVDDPVMGPENGRYRTDVSITVFLTPPESYDGGELVVETAFGEQAVRLPAGHAVIYPSSSLHRVPPVTRGERLVAVAWAQSMVRDPARRQILYDLHLVHERLRNRDADSDEARRIGHVRANLMRMWAEV